MINKKKAPYLVYDMENTIQVLINSIESEPYKLRIPLLPADHVEDTLNLSLIIQFNTENSLHEKGIFFNYYYQMKFRYPHQDLGFPNNCDLIITDMDGKTYEYFWNQWNEDTKMIAYAEYEFDEYGNPSSHRYVVLQDRYQNKIKYRFDHWGAGKKCTNYPSEIHLNNGKIIEFRRNSYGEIEGIHRDMDGELDPVWYDGLSAGYSIDESDSYYSKYTFIVTDLDETERKIKLYFLKNSTTLKKIEVYGKYRKEYVLMKKYKITQMSQDYLQITNVESNLKLNVSRFSYRYRVRYTQLHDYFSDDTIRYSTRYTEIENIKKQKKYKCFYGNNLIAYEIDENGGVTNYLYDKEDKSMLTSKSYLPCCKEKAILMGSLIENGFDGSLDKFIYKYVTSELENSEPHRELMGEMALKMGGLTGMTDSPYIMREFQVNGEDTDVFNFSFWKKGSRVEVTLSVYQDNHEVKTITQYIDESRWDCHSLEIKPEEKYNKIKIKITLISMSGLAHIDGLSLYLKPLENLYIYNESGSLISQMFGNHEMHYQYNINHMLHTQGSSNAELYEYSYDQKDRLKNIETLYGPSLSYEYKEKSDYIESEKLTYKKEYMELLYYYEENWKNFEKYRKKKFIDDTESISETYVNITSGQILEEQDGEGNYHIYEYKEDKLQCYKLSTNQITYDQGKNIDKIKINNHPEYVYQYDQYDRLENIKYQVVDENGESQPYQFVEYKYEDGSYNNQLFITNKVKLIDYGQNREKFFYTYNTEDLVSEIKIQRENGILQEGYVGFQYDGLGRPIQINDACSNEEINFYYNKTGTLSEVIDQDGNKIDYGYDKMGKVVSKDIYYDFETLGQSYHSLDQFIPYTFSRKVKQMKKIYSCLFDEESYISGNTVISNAATMIDNGLKDIKEKKPITGNDLNCIKKDNRNIIEYKSNSSRLAYTIYDMNKGMISFWFKPTDSPSGKCVFSIGNQGTTLYLALYEPKQGESFYVLYIRSTSGDWEKSELLVEKSVVDREGWNFLLFTWEVKRDIKYTLNINNQIYTKEVSPSVYVSQEKKDTINIGCGKQNDVYEQKCNFDLGMLFISDEYIEDKQILDQLYYEGHHHLLYVSNLDDKMSKTAVSNLYSNYKDLIKHVLDVIPLNHSLESLEGLKPIYYSKDVKSEFKRTFVYTDKIKRYLYHTAGQTLQYRFGLSDYGTIGLKVLFENYGRRQCVLHNIDENGRELELFITKDNRLSVAVEGISYSITLPIEKNELNSISLSWKLLESNPEYGYNYVFTIGCQNNRVDIYPSNPLGFRFTSFRTSIGRKGTSKEQDLGALMEGLYYRNSYTTKVYYDTYIKPYLSVSSKTKKYDVFNLPAQETIQNDNFCVMNKTYQYTTYPKMNNMTKRTSQIKSEKMYCQNGEINREYQYNGVGNIVDIFSVNDGYRYKYKYNNLNRLIEEKLVHNNQKNVYMYDDNGNVLTIKKYTYTPTGSGDIDEEDSVTQYIYDSMYKDRLVKFKHKEIEKEIKYESLNPFNPTFYGKNNMGIKYEWDRRNLIQYKDEVVNLDITYTYNYQNLRKTKKVGGLTTEYFYEGENIIFERRSDNVSIFYIYDENNLLYGFIKNNKVYYYIRDILENIIGLIDKEGKIVVRYEYDAYGNVLSIVGDITLGKSNPFLYKGYYYDHDTKMYYCKSRYYIPEWRRWLNADSITYLDASDMNGMNLFSYCGNNPVMNVDPDGNAWWHWVLGIGAALVITAGIILATPAISTATLMGSIAIGAAKGTLIGAAIGTGVGVVGGGIYSMLSGENFWTSVGQGAALGFGVGAVAGFSIGGYLGANGFYNRMALEFTHTGNSGEFYLGRSADSYNTIASKNGASYFHSERWKQVHDMFGVGDKGMWKINKIFINNQLAAGNLPVLISQPVSYGYYAKEIAYLIGKGIIIPL